MEGFLTRGSELILFGCGGTSALARGAPEGSTFTSPGSWSCTEMEGLVTHGWELILPGVRWLYGQSLTNQRSASGTGVSKPCGAVSTREITVFVPRLSELQMCGEISDPGMGPCRPRVALALFWSPSQSAIGRKDWGFHTSRGGFDPGDRRFRPCVVGVVDAWREF